MKVLIGDSEKEKSLAGLLPILWKLAQNYIDSSGPHDAGVADGLHLGVWPQGADDALSVDGAQRARGLEPPNLGTGSRQQLHAINRISSGEVQQAGQEQELAAEENFHRVLATNCEGSGSAGGIYSSPASLQCEQRLFKCSPLFNFS